MKKLKLYHNKGKLKNNKVVVKEYFSESFDVFSNLKSMKGILQVDFLFSVFQYIIINFLTGIIIYILKKKDFNYSTWLQI